MPKYVHDMACRYRWLSQALDDLSLEIEYVRSEFGNMTAQRTLARIHEGVRQLCLFPYSGLHYEDLLYNGNEVRILHIRQISIIYSIDNEMITLIAVWNNYQNPARLQQVIEKR